MTAHLDLHTEIEDEIRSILSEAFDRPLCRTDVLLNIVHSEFMALDDVAAVSMLTEDLLNILGGRASNDLTLFNVVGSA